MSASTIGRLAPFAVAVGLSVVQPASSHEVQVYDPVVEFCEDFNHATGTNLVAIVNYVLGFVSGAAVYSGKDNLRGLSAGDVSGYMTRYCRAHPEETIRIAVANLFDSWAGRH
nr:hypothetical protein [uncultured Rhodopila sp.]